MDVLPDPEAAPTNFHQNAMVNSESDNQVDHHNIPVKDRRQTTSNQERNRSNKMRQKAKNQMNRATKDNTPFTCPVCEFMDRRSKPVLVHVYVFVY